MGLGFLGRKKNPLDIFSQKVASLTSVCMAFGAMKNTFALVYVLCGVRRTALFTTAQAVISLVKGCVWGGWEHE